MSRSSLRVALLAVFFATVVPSAIAAGSQRPLPLNARLLKRGEFAGFTPQAPRSYGTAKAWVATGAHTGLTAAQARSEVARLTHEGFKKLLTEFLNSALGKGSGLSWVMQLGSPASARAELAAEARRDRAQGHVAETFQVRAIPGAFAFGDVGGGSGGGENIVFADGPFLYLLGNGWSGSAHNPKHAALIAAATKLYKRVHGHPAG
jgi:hypothetical protein